MVCLPQYKGDRETAPFDEWFVSYQKISVGDTLIVNPSQLQPNKLVRTPNMCAPQFIVTDIAYTGFLKRHKFVTIERL